MKRYGAIILILVLLGAILPLVNLILKSEEAFIPHNLVKAPTMALQDQM